MIEIGPGPGGLTRALLLEGARHVTAIERDPRCLAALAELAAGLSRPAHRRSRAMRSRSIRRGSAPAPRKIVANLPYNIATPLLLGWLGAIGAYREPDPDVPEGSRAAPRRRAAHQGLRPALGADAVALPGRAGCSTCRRSAFVPAPKVTSTVVPLDAARRRRWRPAVRTISSASRPPPSVSAARCCARACKLAGRRNAGT